jgi:hypothetical protein
MRRMTAVLALVAWWLLLATGNIQAHPVSDSDVQRAAQGWLLLDSHPLGSALAPLIHHVEPIAADTGETIGYIVHLDSSGFIVVAPDDQIPPIIAFSASGTYDPSPAHPLTTLLRNDLRCRLEAVRTGSSAPPAEDRLHVAAGTADGTPAQQKWRRLMDVGEGRGSDLHIFGLTTPGIDDARVDPLLEIEGIRWSQGSLLCGKACYNYYTPRVVGGIVMWEAGNAENYYCGCAATALAQLMRFYKYPQDPLGQRALTVDVLLDPVTQNKQTVSRSLRGGTGPNGRYNWDLMDPRPDCKNANESRRREIGALCFDIGLAVNSTYGPTTTEARLSNAKEPLLAIFHYRNAVDVWCADCNQPAGLAGMINPNLDARRPVILGLKNGTNGHGAVCDGYGDHLSTTYYHLNLGWDVTNRTAYDIWYNLPDVNSPTSPYTIVQECLYNVFPDVTGEIISGRVRDAHGVPLAHVTVRAAWADGTHACETVTDARGIYALVGCTSETDYLVRVEGVVYPAGSLTGQTRVRTGTSLDRCLVSGNRWAVDFPAASDLPEPRVVYVNCGAIGGTRTGASWADAFPHLQDALSAVASDPDGSRPVEIWVARGTYTPGKGTGTDRSASFQLMNGAAVYGGFAGGETQRQQRNPEANPTILSGDLAGNDQALVGTPADGARADNSYHVIRNSGNNLLDGFTIQAGNAGGSDPNQEDWDEYGGALLISVGHPTIRDCRFVSNQANMRGGAVYCGRQCGPLISQCRFTDNEALHGSGGAAFNEDESEPNFTGCMFLNNRAAERSGGALYNNDQSAVLITGCNFTANEANWGGAIYNDSNSVPHITACTFNGNRALQQTGGAIYNAARATTSLLECEFRDNAAPWGGAIYCENSEPNITACRFEGNHATYGAALYGHLAFTKLTACTFLRNVADSTGGVLHNYDSSVRAMNCLFAENKATSPTGANTWGGAIISYGKSASCSVELTNCTLAANTARSGNSIVCDSDTGRFPSRVQVANCILADDGTKVYAYDLSILTVEYTDVVGGSGTAMLLASRLQWGAGNLAVSPQFETGGYHLTSNSLCIDAGNNADLPPDMETDLDGKPRIVKGRTASRTLVVDMGAYEYQ